jgi:CHAD domain-containing protein
MAALRITRGSLQKRYRERTKELLDLAIDLPSRPSPDQIHDLRVVVRRIQMTLRLLPKNIRESQSFKRFNFSLKSVLKATSRLRDLDTLTYTLELHKATLPGELLVTLENQRSDEAARARAATEVLTEVPAPDLDTSLVRGKKLSRRLRKQVRKSKKVTTGLMTDVMNAESKVNELHALRKEIKKMRYLLELGDGSPSEVASLTKWQESLGAIHDLDVAASYLEGSHMESKRKVILDLMRTRHAHYLTLVREYRKDLIKAPREGYTLSLNPLTPSGIDLS